MEADLQALGLEQQSLNALVNQQGQLSERSEHTYLQTIGALNYTILDKSPAANPCPFSRAKPRSSMLSPRALQTFPVFSKRTLDAKFAAANRVLKKTT